jgi:hypothetical protein
MSADGGLGRRRERQVDRDALPDPSLWAKRESPHGRAIRRVVLVSAVLLAILGASAFALRGVLERVGRARSASSQILDGLPVRQAAEPERPPVSPEELAALQRSWVGSRSIAPREDRVDPTTGERVGAFQGFGLQIDGAPGARVFVNGEEMGTAPLLTTVDCRPGDDVEVRAVRGRETARAATKCRKDVLVKLVLALRPAR